MRSVQCKSSSSCLCRRVRSASQSSRAKAVVPETALTHGSCRAIVQRVIAAWLRVHGQPLKRVAARLGVAESTVSQWAKGRRFPRPAELDALAEYAGVATVCLFCPILAETYEAHAGETTESSSTALRTNCTGATSQWVECQ